MENNLISLQANFGISAKNKINSILHKYLKSQIYYKSPVIGYINGNVVRNLHLTLFYGQVKGYPAIETLSGDLIWPAIKIDKVELRNGYRSLYKIVCLYIDMNPNILEWRERIIKEMDLVDNYEFNGHITLAYVKNSITTEIDLLQNDTLANVNDLIIENLTVHKV